MPLIPVNLNDAQESKPVPNGRYDVQIVGCEAKVSKKGDPMLRVMSTVQGDHDAPPIFTYLMLPDVGQEEEVLKRNMLGLRRFMQCFKIPVNPEGIDTDLLQTEMVGKEANVEVTQEVYQETGAVSNQLKIPRLKDDGGGAGRGSPPARKR